MRSSSTALPGVIASQTEVHCQKAELGSFGVSRQYASADSTTTTWISHDTQPSPRGLRCGEVCFRHQSSSTTFGILTHILQASIEGVIMCRSPRDCFPDLMNTYPSYSSSALRYIMSPCDLHSRSGTFLTFSYWSWHRYISYTSRFCIPIFYINLHNSHFSKADPRHFMSCLCLSYKKRTHGAPAYVVLQFFSKHE
jgi:hypothetical protein